MPPPSMDVKALPSSLRRRALSRVPQQQEAVILLESNNENTCAELPHTPT